MLNTSNIPIVRGSRNPDNTSIHPYNEHEKNLLLNGRVPASNQNLPQGGFPSNYVPLYEFNVPLESFTDNLTVNQHNKWIPITQYFNYSNLLTRFQNQTTLFNFGEPDRLAIIATIIQSNTYVNDDNSSNKYYYISHEITGVENNLKITTGAYPDRVTIGRSNWGRLNDIRAAYYKLPQINSDIRLVIYLLNQSVIIYNSCIKVSFLRKISNQE